MSKKRSFVAHCELCKKNITYRFTKNQLLRKSSNLYSGIFLHKSKDNGIHAVLAYFDENLAHRGTEASKIIQTDGISLEFVQKSPSLSSSEEELTLKKDIKVFYEWLINEYIGFFKLEKIRKTLVGKRVDSTLIKFLASKRVNPILERVLDKTRDANPIYKKFVFSDKANSLIATTFQEEDLLKIKESELKGIYQTFFDCVKTHFYAIDKNDALETSRKLGLEIVNRWGEISDLDLPEDMFQILEEEPEMSREPLRVRGSSRS